MSLPTVLAVRLYSFLPILPSLALASKPNPLFSGSHVHVPFFSNSKAIARLIWAGPVLPSRGLLDLRYDETVGQLKSLFPALLNYTTTGAVINMSGRWHM